MSQMLSNIILALALIACLHPIYTIATQPYFSCKKNKLTFYTNINQLSIFAHKRIVIASSVILFCLYTVSNIFFLSVPLLAISWISFIRDRFKSISRGLGAPGYFSFFTIFSICVLEQSNLIESQNLFVSSTYMLLVSIVYIEFGHIFISAGIFKFLDSRKNSLSFAMGMMNPMWSRIYGNFKLIHKFRYPLNYLGPINQILGGLLLLSGNFICQIIGCMILALTFISITPFCKLAWLCPSISFTSLYLASKLDLISSNNMYIFYSCLFIRAILSLQLFVEYFQNQSLKIPILNSIMGAYRNLMGVIIWKVFTYDVVKYIGPSPSYNSYLVKSNESINKSSLYKFNESFCSVYHSIAMCSFLSSQNYLNKEAFDFRLNKYLSILNLSSLPFLSLNQKDFIDSNFDDNPFHCSNFLELRTIKSYTNSSEDIYNQVDFNSYIKS